ncbi:hypothetical protein RRG08_056345 [Elysia crispata]|uniref:Uncharacterized protein n=1 Tax=Elysia crispata TaxID=231223 RepID=A0AAE1D2X6_9GAST|nr:hypothetical protein RRG08_056345 [Elysia crispata]
MALHHPKAKHPALIGQAEHHGLQLITIQTAGSFTWPNRIAKCTQLDTGEDFSGAKIWEYPVLYINSVQKLAVFEEFNRNGNFFSRKVTIATSKSRVEDCLQFD